MKANRGVFLVLLGVTTTVGLWALPGGSSPLWAGPQVPGDAASGDKVVWREVVTLKHEHAVHCLTCSTDLCAAADEGGNSFVWSTKTGKDRVPLMKGIKDALGVRLQFTVGGNDLYMNRSGRHGIMRFPVKDKKIASGNGFGVVGNLGISPDGETWLESYGEGDFVTLRRNLYSGAVVIAKPFEVVRFQAKVTHAIVSADNQCLAVATDDGTLHVHRRDTLAKMHTIASGKERVAIHDIQFSPDGARIAVARDDAIAKVYDTAKGEEISAFKGHSGIVFAVAFSPDGKRVVSGGDDNVARIWDASSGKELTALKGHTDSVRCVAFDPTGEILVTGSADKTVKLWQAK